GAGARGAAAGRGCAPPATSAPRWPGTRASARPDTTASRRRRVDGQEAGISEIRRSGSASAPSPAGREPGERLVGELEYSPLRERLGAELLVESDRRRIPVERRPLESDAAPLDREAGHAPQQRRADPPG